MTPDPFALLLSATLLVSPAVGLTFLAVEARAEGHEWRFRIVLVMAVLAHAIWLGLFGYASYVMWTVPNN